MPEISLLNPTVLNGVVEKFTTPENMLASSAIFGRSEPSMDPTAKWDVIEGNREMASPNVPNSEAHIVPQLGVGQRTAAFVYLREKKVFSPTTLRWLREPGKLASKNAEAKVLREVRDLDRRFEAYLEFLCWEALRGTITIAENDVIASVDYGIPASHEITITSANDWLSTGTTVVDWISSIIGFKRLISLDARVPATDVWLNGLTWSYVTEILATTPAILSDRMKEAVLNTGEVKGLLGMTWHVYDAQYVNSGGSTVPYIADDEVFITSSANNAFFKMEGPSADEDAPRGHIGKFVKSWTEPDPSARQHLEEWHVLPIIERPEQVVRLIDVRP